MHYLLDRVHNELLLSKMAYNGKNTIVTGIFGGVLESQVCHLGVDITSILLFGLITLLSIFVGQLF